MYICIHTFLYIQKKKIIYIIYQTIAVLVAIKYDENKIKMRCLVNF